MLATALSTPVHGELHLTRVVSRRGREISSIDEELERTRHYLLTVIERMQHHRPGKQSMPRDLVLTWSITMADDVASGIMQAAEGGGSGKVAASCQVIAMTAHGRSDEQL
jgi:hypothetical protein